MKLSTLEHTLILLELGSSRCWVVWCTHMLLVCREDGRFQRLPGTRGLAGALTGKEARGPLSLVCRDKGDGRERMPSGEARQS